MKALDIFCGGGGGSYGASQGGADIVCGIDLDATATATYADNFPNAKVLTAKLEDVPIRALRRSIGDIDLLLASPECTNHTCAKGSAPRSEASRATAMQVLRYARGFKPRWIIMENVVHMRPWSRYSELKEALEGLGYHIRELILDAADFGVPQSRRRLFVVCSLGRSFEEFCPPVPARRRTVEDILDIPGAWEMTALYRPGRAVPTLERAERGFAEVGLNASFLIVYYGTDGSGGWQRLDRPLRTITTVDRFALVTPSATGHKMRMLQVPELRRAMGFDGGYTMLRGTRREKIRLLGNGVCPPVMTSLVRHLEKC